MCGRAYEMVPQCSELVTIGAASASEGPDSAPTCAIHCTYIVHTCIYVHTLCIQPCSKYMYLRISMYTGPCIVVYIENEIRAYI